MFLRTIQRTMSTLLSLFGLALSALFFIWIERHCALPWIPRQFGFPWVDLAAESSPLQAFWNLAVLALFFFLPHSLLARSSIKSRLGLFPERLYRSTYVTTAGLGAFLVMALWQNTGILLYAAPLSSEGMLLTSLLGFWGPLVVVASASPSALHWPAFFGFAAQPKRETLSTTGLYALCRHPLYLAILVALSLSPLLSLDRLLILVGTASYLTIAIPLEERDLEKRFPKEYASYRERVPRLFPWRLFGAR